MLLYINSKQLERIVDLMSQFLDDARAILERVAQGNGDLPGMKEDVEALKTMLTANTEADAANKASDEEVRTLLLEILNKLAVSTPPAPPPA